jgi:hypothetical protein
MARDERFRNRTHIVEVTDEYPEGRSTGWCTVEYVNGGFSINLWEPVDVKAVGGGNLTALAKSDKPIDAVRRVNQHPSPFVTTSPTLGDNNLRQAGFVVEPARG